MTRITTEIFVADDLYRLRDKVNDFLLSVPKFRVKDVQYCPADGWKVGESPTFGAWVVYEVEV